MKQPSILQGEEFYTKWMHNLEICMLLTDLLKQKQGPTVFLLLPQNIQECVRHLSIADIGKDA